MFIIVDHIYFFPKASLGFVSKANRFRGRMCYMSSILTLIVLFSSSLHAESAANIAKRALQTAPPGNWNFSAALTTKGEASDGIEPGEKSLTMSFKDLGKAHQLTFRGEGGEGLRITISSGGSVTLKDLATDASPKSLQSSFLGSAFSLEDLSLKFLSWNKQELMGEDTLKDRQCWKIASYPSGNSRYSKVVSWIDQKYQALLKAIAYDAEGNVLKEFNVRSFQQLEDVWMLKTLELNAPAIGVKSRLEILDAKRQS
jgi:hypothetical protein